jgi:hypothetical protein
MVLEEPLEEVEPLALEEEEAAYSSLGSRTEFLPRPSLHEQPVGNSLGGAHFTISRDALFYYSRVFQMRECLGLELVAKHIVGKLSAFFVL